MAITREQAENDGMLGGGCPELKGKEKIDWDDLAFSELTINEIVKTKNADGEELIAIITKEYPNNFMWAGAAIANWVNFYGDDFIGTVIKVGGMEKTKAGRKCRHFDIV